ncbi:MULTISPECIES: peptide-methionine (R)-S-oxide reductase MsrB [Actibacterium]|uniref:peptide-methionine (R)-S-oxide reductase n=1 Tax=Actibacterium naphthalenivorans TaxID=1614693 RepID=A0A840C3Z3_9RHOB|nr:MULTISPECIES: peptide-methionine (R)-S-oxide reductase MsrB [Actibacterium]ALG89850.1 methionine sulfoxide reductase B [Actibacterium sp. EMB200-NS6]MBB4020434.1 peptide-methionine (R)-S-oxide reductase [Actibacterium naphthalenivorans]
MNRRGLLKATCAAALLAGVPRALLAASFEVTRSDAEWRAMLSDLEYSVMRREGTERPFTSPLNDEKRAGLFHCRGCDLPLYDAAAKYDSGTGWPSFWQALPGAVQTKQDRKFLMLRTEVHCRRCGSHLGHIFDDGPKPTGKRHCLNGVSLRFEPA